MTSWLAALLLFFGTATALQAQSQPQHRTCHTVENLERLKAEDPQYAQRLEAIEAHTNRFIERSKAQRTENQIINIPVVVHVIYSNSTENISQAQIESQITVLNDDFRRLNADASNTPSQFAGRAADVEIEFALATTAPNGSATNGITRKSSSRTSWGTNDEMKFSSNGGVDAWPTDQYLNMWVCNIGGGILGYAQFPGGSAATDGVVMSPQYFGSSDYGSNFYLSAPFDKGRTTTHEVGHWLNLRHIWGDGNCNQDDFVSDTPVAGNPNYGCPSFGTNSCNSGGGDEPDMFMNYMDYVDDACMNLFSEGQKTRMRALFAAGGARESFADGSTGGGGSTTCQGTDVALSLTTDNYGSETSWELRNAAGTVVESGSGYANNTTYTFNWSLPADDYTFEIFDSYGDGICCSYGNGSYSLSSGGTTFASGGDFGSSEQQNFCTEGTTGGTSCGTPDGLTATNVTTTTFTLNWNAVSGADTYDVRLRASGTTAWSDFNGQTGTSLSLTGATPATTYEYQVRAVCGGTTGDYSASAFVTTESAAVSYCNSEASNDYYLWIDSFTLGSINNNSGRDGGYGDYTNLSTILQRGSGYSLSIGVGRLGRYRTAYRVWIDYNRDGDFTDSGELIYNRSRTTSTNIGGSFTVPSSAAIGDTRMRVSMKYNASSGSCENFTYGEVEDYTVSISDPAARTSRLQVYNGATPNARPIGNGDEDLAYDEIRTEGQLTLYPVPAQTTLNVQSDLAKGTVRVYDMLGKAVLQQEVSGNSFQLNVARLPAGTYILSLENDTSITRRKFVKRK